MLDDQFIDFYFSDFKGPTMSSKQSAAQLEAQGWHEWLMTLCPFAFEEEFSADQIKFWDLYWSVLNRIREQRKYFKMGLVPVDAAQQRIFFEARNICISEDEWNILCIWGRGLAKSSTIEAAAMMRGCLLGGYCVYVCEAQDQAEEHIGNIKVLIDNDDSRVTEFYPHMVIDEEARFKDKKIKNAVDIFITAGGFIVRAKGLNASLRGIRVGNLRPDNICLDDLDSVNDSIAVSLKKLKEVSSKVIPTQARRHATILGGQNLIGETTVFSMIYTGQSDVLAARTVIGISNTFERFEVDQEYITYLDEETGRIRHKILPAAVPTWKGVDTAAAQKFLNDSGLETFLAEYMNSFAHLKTGKVFHEFNEARHLITWDMFEAKMGHRHIPGHWRAKAAGDIGYSKESLSAWLWVANAAQNSALPGRYFAYRSRTFMYDSIDDQAIKFWEDMFPDPTIGKKHFEATTDFIQYPELYRVLATKPQCAQFLRNFEYNPVQNKYELKKLDPETIHEVSEEDRAMFYVRQAQQTFRSQIGSWTISHEKTGEQKTLAQKYGIPASKVRRFEADAGVAEANHLLRGDYTVPHPFYPDEIEPDTGLYRLGSPFIFFLVDRIKAPQGDQDFKTFREQVSAQPWTREKLTDLGLSKTIPFKYQSDHCFVAGTMITTDRGQIPIEDIQPGDMILTRKGYRRCKEAGMTNPSTEIWSLTTEDGIELRGTPNHPVWTEDKGFIELCLVRDAYRMLLWHGKLNPTHNPGNLSTLTGHGSAAILNRLIDTCETISSAIGGVAALIYTLLSGSPSTATFPMDTRFTTPTITRSTTTSPIWNASPEPSIRNTTKPHYRKIKRMSEWLIFGKQVRRQRNGIEAPRGESGTANTLKRRFFQLWSLSRLSANSAESRKHPARPGGIDSAPLVASSEPTTVWKKLKRTASFVKSRFRRPSTATGNIAPVSVRAARPTYDSQPVYNLSVEEVSEYFANGLLVHNCDAFRMFCVDYAMPESTQLTTEEQVQKRIPPKHRPVEGEIVTPEAQMSRLFARELAEEKTKQELGLDDYDDFEDDDVDV